MIVSNFTQIVWKSTKEIGLTFSYDEDKYVVQAVYNPTGNITYSYQMNINRPINSRPARDLEIAGLSYQTGDYIHFKKLK